MDSTVTINLSHQFIDTIRGTFGESGNVWLTQLPELIHYVEQQYDLTIAQPVPNLSFNFVAPAISTNGQELMVKLGVPNKELSSEIASLELCGGRGTVNLIDADAERGILIQERLRPGHSLVPTFPEDDEMATQVTAEVMQKFWQPVPQENPFPTVYDWSFGLKKLRQMFDGGVGPFPQDLVDEAENLYAELIPSMDDVVVLHGDLHHDNILAATREPWLIIDPKGVIGEPAYEVGAFLRNPQLTHPALHKVTERRVSIFTEMLGLDRQRIIGWGIAQAVLSSWWSFESGDNDWADVLVCARILQNL